MKRQQIIKKWLNGIDDPLYEVFPTKVENKNIVKKRTEPLPDQVNEESNEQTDDNTTEQVDDKPTEEVDDKPTQEVKPKPTQPKKMVPKPKSKALSSKSEPIPTIPKHIREANPADLTISYEILNQLKELGNEIKQQRMKKEQKSMIKQVVQKQMAKRPNRKRVVEQITDGEEDEYEYEYEETQPKPKPQHKRTESKGYALDPKDLEEPPESEIQLCSQPQPVFKSRIRR